MASVDLPPPADQIRALMEMDKRVPELLSLLSSALTSLLPHDPGAPPVLDAEGNPEDLDERFVNVARKYYDEIDDIQLVLRSTVARLRLARALPTPADFVPPPPSQLPPVPFSSTLPDVTALDQESGKQSFRSSNLGLNGLRLEVENLRRMKAALEALREQEGKPPLASRKKEEPPAESEKEVKQEVDSDEDEEMDEVVAH